MACCIASTARCVLFLSVFIAACAVTPSSSDPAPQGGSGGEANADNGGSGGHHEGGAGGVSVTAKGGSGGADNSKGGASAGGGNSAGRGGSAGSGGAAGAMSAGGNAGASSQGGSAGGSAGAGCGAGAAFCSGFEDAGLPTAAKYQPAYQANDWAKYMAIDDAVFHAGKHSLRINPLGGGYAHSMLAVPSGSQTFWSRVWIRSDVDVGQAEHNFFVGASTSDGDPNQGDTMEVAEQYCQIVLNLHDGVTLSGGNTACGTGGALIKKNTWACLETFFDGASGDVRVYVDGTEIINKPGLAKLKYQTFKVGFGQFHGPARSLWYDDVVVSSARAGCQ